MKTTLINQYARAKSVLLKRRNELQKEIEQIDTTLNGGSNGTHAPAVQHGPAKNKTSLRESVEAVLRLAGRPLSKAEILERVTKAGYRFTTSDPANSLNAMLYSASGKKSFKRKDGKFWV